MEYEGKPPIRVLLPEHLEFVFFFDGNGEVPKEYRKRDR